MQSALNSYLSANQLDAEHAAALLLCYVDIRLRLVAHDFPFASVPIYLLMCLVAMQITLAKRATAPIQHHAMNSLLPSSYGELSERGGRTDILVGTFGVTGLGREVVNENSRRADLWPNDGPEAYSFA